MKKIIFAAVSMLILAGSIGFGFYANAAAERYFARDVVYIAPRINESRLHFNISDVELLEISFPDYAIAATARSGARIVSSLQETSATVIYTNAAYFNMHSINFIEGNHAGENSIIINEALAWRLFGATENITELTVWIDDVQFIIAGIVRQGESHTSWIPREAGSQNMLVTALYIKPNSPNPLAEYQARTILSDHLHKNPVEYSIIEINRFVESIGIRHQLLLYLVWLSALIFFLRKIFVMLTKKLFSRILIFSAAGAVFCLYVLWGVNDILLWLPNLSVIDSSLFEVIFTVNALPPDVYLSAGLLRISQLSRYGNYAFITGIIGFVSLLFSMRR